MFLLSTLGKIEHKMQRNKPHKIRLRPFIPMLGLLITLLSMGTAEGIKSAELGGKLFVGYQGWFGCPGDFEGYSQWQHWFADNTPDAAHLRVDMLPSLGQFNPQDLCNTSLLRADGSPVQLFSSQNERVVSAHFAMMAKYGIDGAAVQRFVGPLSNPRNRQRSDHVILNAKAGAEANGRVFYITYDVSGASAQTVINDIRDDWRHLAGELKLTSSPAYLKAGGKAVIELWGFGFTDRPGSADEVLGLLNELKTGATGLEAAMLIGGVPTNWRTLDGDSKSDPSWARVYRSFDVISPWAAGRFSDAAGIDSFMRTRVLPDMEETKQLQIGYMPVIFPGFSWSNMQRGLGNHGAAVLNRIPRQCGEFFWRQIYSLLGADVDMLYTAMFDEVDEGTAVFPVETKKEKVPLGVEMVTLDQDGCSLPDDWYLQVTGQAAKFLRSRQHPPRALSEALAFQTGG